MLDIVIDLNIYIKNSITKATDVSQVSNIKQLILFFKKKNIKQLILLCLQNKTKMK